MRSRKFVHKKNKSKSLYHLYMYIYRGKSNKRDAPLVNQVLFMRPGFCFIFRLFVEWCIREEIKEKEVMGSAERPMARGKGAKGQEKRVALAEHLKVEWVARSRVGLRKKRRQESNCNCHFYFRFLSSLSPVSTTATSSSSLTNREHRGFL